MIRECVTWALCSCLCYVSITSNTLSPLEFLNSVCVCVCVCGVRACVHACVCACVCVCVCHDQVICAE